MKIRKKDAGLKRRSKRRNGILVAVTGILLVSAWYILGKSYVYEGLGTPGVYPVSRLDMDCLYINEDGFKVYDDGTVEGVPGIDVSAYQGSIDWERVRAAGVEFVMIRLGYSSTADGALHMDERFEENIEGALDAGLMVGVYFFSQAINTGEAIEEAEFVVQNLREYDITGPVAFDMEPVGEDDRISDLTVEERTEIADAFCGAIESYGYTGLIYGNSSWLSDSIDLSYLTDHHIWLAHYNRTTDFPYKFVMWQYSSEGEVDGIEGYVDLNIYFGE